MCECFGYMHACMHTKCVLGAVEGGKGLLDSLELEVWMAVTNHLGRGN